METLISTLTSNKILLIIFILLISLIVYSILKRLIKIIVILIIALVLYMGYMNYKGEKVDDTLRDVLNKGGKELKVIQQQKDKLSNVIEPVKKPLK